MSRRGYPEAGKHAQPEVKKAITRFFRLPTAEQAATTLLDWLFNDSLESQQPNAAEALYKDVSPVRGETCAICAYAYQNVPSMRYICPKIDQDIKPGGWCRRYLLASKIGRTP